MKRKRNQPEETNQNCNEEKKLRFTEESPNSCENFDFDLDLCSENKKEEFVLTREIAEHEILSDISGNKWRVGEPVGKGSFGEIFLASDDIAKPVNHKNSTHVIKIEPHSNGPLFVEIHCLLNVKKQNENEINENLSTTLSLPENVGIPKYIASGSHCFNECRYRFLIMPRYKIDLHSILKCGRLSQKHFLIVASQIIDVLMLLHKKNYVHSDIKAENIMIGLCQTGNKTSKSSVDLPGNGLRKGRAKNQQNLGFFHNSHNLRPTRSIAYIDENSRSSQNSESQNSDNSDEDEDFEVSPKKRKSQKTSRKRKITSKKAGLDNLADNLKSFNRELSTSSELDSDEKVFVIDYGLATKFVNTVDGVSVHKPFCCDERRAHDGTIEFTSRDAHFGAHSRRSDLECLGFNLIYWSQGFLPWKDEKLKEQPEIVHRLKEVFMTDVKEMLKLLYGKDVPRYLGEFMHYVAELEFDEEPDYLYLKELFEKELLKLGYTESDMKLNLREMRNECEITDKNVCESELMLSKITDVKTARKLGFLIVTDSVDGTEAQIKSNEVINLSVSSKASPKNLRSKEKTKGKRSKRQPKVTEKELIIEKMTQGKKLSLSEIALLDPEQFARARADREYEKSEEKNQFQTPQKYHGNPTYAILEIENKLKLRQKGSIISNVVPSNDVEPIKGYTKQMMEILQKQQFMVEKQLLPCQQKRNRDGLRNVIKPTKKNVSYENEKAKTVRKSISYRNKQKSQRIQETVQESLENFGKKTKVSRAKRVPKVQKIEPNLQLKIDETTNDVEEVEKPVKRKRGRPKIIKNIIIPPETEEDSVYYDIPGEGSNYDVKDISEDENSPELIPQKRSRNASPSSDENSNQCSVGSGNDKIKNQKGQRGNYYANDDFDVSTDEATNMSLVSQLSETTQKIQKSKQICNSMNTRQKTKSRSTSARSTSRSTSDNSECSESDYELQSEEESLSASDDGVDDNSNDSNDSIDFKYSPITKTRNTRRSEIRNVKSIRGRRINVVNENDRNFRLVSTQG